MDLTIKVYDIYNIDKIEGMNKVVNEVNYQKYTAKLECDYRLIVNLFKQMKEQGLIKSIYIPKNKRLTKEISNLIRIKKEIKNTINKINSLYK
mgnify:CR=1 FL=1